MSKVIAIANQKGGTGKSVTACNLGIGLVRSGKRVLIIDADSQGSLSASLGVEEPDELDIALHTIIGKIVNDEEFDVDLGIMHHEEGVDFLPCNIELAGLEQSLINVISREHILKNYINMQADRYDYIIIDCMPSLGVVTINALTAADTVLIPVQASYLPIKGLQQLLVTIGKVRRHLNPSLTIEGILFTMVDARTNFSRNIIEKLKEAYGENVDFFSTDIPKSVRAEETTAEGKSIYSYDPKGKVSKAYEELVKEVLANDIV